MSQSLLKVKHMRMLKALREEEKKRVFEQGRRESLCTGLNSSELNQLGAFLVALINRNIELCDFAIANDLIASISNKSSKNGSNEALTDMAVGINFDSVYQVCLKLAQSSNNDDSAADILLFLVLLSLVFDASVLPQTLVQTIDFCLSKASQGKLSSLSVSLMANSLFNCKQLFKLSDFWSAERLKGIDRALCLAQENAFCLHPSDVLLACDQLFFLAPANSQRLSNDCQSTLNSIYGRLVKLNSSGCCPETSFSALVQFVTANFIERPFDDLPFEDFVVLAEQFDIGSQDKNLFNNSLSLTLFFCESSDDQFDRFAHLFGPQLINSIVESLLDRNDERKALTLMAARFLLFRRHRVINETINQPRTIQIALDSFRETQSAEVKTQTIQFLITLIKTAKVDENALYVTHPMTIVRPLVSNFESLSHSDMSSVLDLMKLLLAVQLTPQNRTLLIDQLNSDHQTTVFLLSFTQSGSEELRLKEEEFVSQVVREWVW